jgi:hypothetical protein
MVLDPIATRGLAGEPHTGSAWAVVEAKFPMAMAPVDAAIAAATRSLPDRWSLLMRWLLLVVVCKLADLVSA